MLMPVWTDPVKEKQMACWDQLVVKSVLFLVPEALGGLSQAVVSWFEGLGAETLMSCRKLFLNWEKPDNHMELWCRVTLLM